MVFHGMDLLNGIDHDHCDCWWRRWWFRSQYYLHLGNFGFLYIYIRLLAISRYRIAIPIYWVIFQYWMTIQYITVFRYHPINNIFFIFNFYKKLSPTSNEMSGIYISLSVYNWYTIFDYFIIILYIKINYLFSGVCYENVNKHQLPLYGGSVNYKHPVVINKL